MRLANDVRIPPHNASKSVGNFPCPESRDLPTALPPLTAPTMLIPTSAPLRGPMPSQDESKPRRTGLKPAEQAVELLAGFVRQAPNAEGAFGASPMGMPRLAGVMQERLAPANRGNAAMIATALHAPRVARDLTNTKREVRDVA